jgi:hypothetical protein
VLTPPELGRLLGWAWLTAAGAEHTAVTWLGLDHRTRRAGRGQTPGRHVSGSFLPELDQRVEHVEGGDSARARAGQLPGSCADPLWRFRLRLTSRRGKGRRNNGSILSRVEPAVPIREWEHERPPIKSITDPGCCCRRPWPPLMRQASGHFRRCFMRSPTFSYHHGLRHVASRGA